jgi:hypothetical protein
MLKQVIEIKEVVNLLCVLTNKLLYMSPEQIYWEEQEYNRAQEIMQKNVMEVTKEEIEFLKKMNMI